MVYMDKGTKLQVCGEVRLMISAFLGLYQIARMKLLCVNLKEPAIIDFPDENPKITLNTDQIFTHSKDDVSSSYTLRRGTYEFVSANHTVTTKRTNFLVKVKDGRYQGIFKGRGIKGNGLSGKEVKEKLVESVKNPNGRICIKLIFREEPESETEDKIKL